MSVCSKDQAFQSYELRTEGKKKQEVKLLKGFRRIHQKAGQSRDVTFRLNREAFRLMNARYEWVVEPGAFRILVGAASDDIRLEGEVTI